MELNETYTVSESSDYTETYEESNDDSDGVEEIYVTASLTQYPKTTSESSFNMDNFDLQNAISTSTSEVTSHVSGSGIDAKPQYHIRRESSIENQKIVRNSTPQKILVKIKKLPRKWIQKDNTSSSESRSYSERSKCNIARKRATKERRRNSENDDSKTFYPDSESDDNYEEWDSIESSESTDTIDEFSESLLDIKVDGFGSTIEHDIVATKYGLPYDIIICPCNALGITQFSLNKHNTLDIPITKNCYNFEERYGKISQRALRKWSNHRRTEEFRKASSVYDMFIKKMDLRIVKILKRAECGMKLFYPYCWILLVEKYQMHLEEIDEYQEMRSKKAVIASCRRVLKEQESFARHYRVRMVDFGRNIKFGKKMRDLDRNFKMGCTFLKKEYPSLFIHLIKKYRFSTFVIKRMAIERNRLRFIKKWRSPEELEIMEAEIRSSRQKHRLY